MSYLIWISRLSLLASLAWMIALEPHPAQAQAIPVPSTPSASPTNPLVKPNLDGSATIDLSPAALAEFEKTQGNFAKAAYWTRHDANKYYSNKNWQQAIKRLQDALDLSRRAEEPIEEAETLTYLAIVHNRFATELNQPKERQKALEYYYQALAQWQKISYPRLQKQDVPLFGTDFSSAAANELNRISVLYLRLGQPKEALDYQIQALLTGEVLPGSDTAERLLLLGYLHNDLKQPQQALEVFNKALSILEAKENKWGQSETLFFMGMVSYLSLNQPQQAVDYFNRAQTVWDSLNSPKVAEALFGKAWIAHKTGKNTEALQLMDQAIARFQKAGDRQGELKISMFKGFLYQVDGKTAEAIASYEQTIATIESLRDSIKLADLKSSFTDKQIDLYQNLIELLWNTGQYEKAFNYVERAKARSFLDQLANARITPNKGATPVQLKKYRGIDDQMRFLQQQIVTLKKQADESFGEKETALLRKDQETKEKELKTQQSEYDVLFRELQSRNPEFASLKSAEVPNLKEIQAQLDSETTLVEYYTTQDRAFAFVITKSSFKSIPLPNASQANLDNQIAVFSNNRKPKKDEMDNSEAQLVLKELHQWLIAPVQAHLKTRKLVVVPHGILHTLPFAALTDGDRYLNEDYALSTLPSASILQFLKGKRKPNVNTILALGKPAIAEPLKDLRFAKPEVEAIAGLYKTIPLLGKNATEQAIWQKGGNAGILHLAAHGEYNPSNPLFSTIYLAGNRQAATDSHSDGRLEAREVYDLDLKATNLVVLSACETQKGKRSTGDEVVGFSRAFIYAGTPSIIATLWSVDDEASGLLMQKFYKHLKGGMEKAEALRQAQIEIRTDLKYRHPYYWAAFTLTGDDGK